MASPAMSSTVPRSTSSTVWVWELMKPGSTALPPAVDDLQIGMVAGEVGALTESRDAAVPYGDGAVFEGTEGRRPG